MEKLETRRRKLKTAFLASASLIFILFLSLFQQPFPPRNSYAIFGYKSRKHQIWNKEEVIGMEGKEAMKHPLRRLVRGGYTMTDFRNFIGKTYNLTMKRRIKRNKSPKMLLISREETRTFANEDELVDMILSLGFKIHKTMTQEMLKLDQFSEVVNSCDVIVGVHGAGMTNEVFLRDGSVVVQVVPLALDWAADTYYKNTAHEMGVKHIVYKIEPKESSLYDVYGPDDPVVSNPLEVFEKGGYKGTKSLYIEGQNVTIDIPRFKRTLIDALEYLGYPSS